jgi:hypothetical protein
MNDNEQFAGKRSAHSDMTRFHQRMIWIRNGERQWIAENSGGFLESAAMLGGIQSRFPQIPFER